MVKIIVSFLCFVGLNLVADSATFTVTAPFAVDCKNKCEFFATTWTGEAIPMDPNIPAIGVTCVCNNPQPAQTKKTVEKAKKMVEAIKSQPSTTEEEKSTLDQVIDKVKVAAEVASNLKAVAEGIEKIKGLYNKHFGKNTDENATEEGETLQEGESGGEALEEVGSDIVEDI